MSRKKKLLEDVTPTQLQSPVEPEGQDQQTQLPSAIEELAQPITEPELEQPQSFGATPESTPRDFLAASLESATNSVEQLFTAQAQLQGEATADAIFDKFEEAFVSRLEQRLQPFVDVVLPNIRETQTQLQKGSRARLERRGGAFDRLKQIASLVTDECRLLPPVVAVGEFVSWDEVQPVQLIEPKENDQ